MQHIVRDYSRAMTRRGLQPGTIATRTAQLRAWLRHIGAPWATATRDDVEGWLDGRPLNARSRYAALSHLHVFYQWAEREGLTTADPTRLIERPRLDHRLPRPVVRRDVIDAIDQADEQMRVVLCLMADAGLRCCEVAGLRWPDVDLVAGTMHVTGKGRRDRVVAIPERLRLQLYLAAAERSGPAAPVIGRELTPARVSQLVGQYFRSIDMAYTAHQLRHTYATRMLTESGYNLQAVQEALGHASVATTQIYAQLDPRLSLEAGWRLTA